MRTRLIAFVMLIGVGLAVGYYVFAQNSPPEELPTFSPGQVLTAAQLNALVARVNALSTVFNPIPEMLPVDCSARETLADALLKAKPGDTIRITGTCREMVTITTDHLTLDGQGGAILDGGGGFQPPRTVGFNEGVITIDGARGVTIIGLTVQNGPDGIAGKHGASFIVHTVTARGNADDGIGVSQNSTAEIINCTAEDNGDDGFSVSNASSAIFRGTIVSTGNSDDGIKILFGSSGFFAEAMVRVNNNGQSATFGSEMFDGFIQGEGIRVIDSSHLNVSGNSTVEARGNADNGISVNRTSTFGTFADPQTGPVTITAEANGQLSASGAGDGIQVGEGSFFTVNGTNATLTVRNNVGHGLNVFGNSRITCPRASVIKTGNAVTDFIENGSCP
jgi:hypothetical protein